MDGHLLRSAGSWYALCCCCILVAIWQKLEKNFHSESTSVIRDDITTVSTDEILERGGFREGDRPALLIGGPPCTPFSKSVPSDKLFGRSAHTEAVARIQYCIAESALGVITGEVGAGKSVAVRAAVVGLDRTRYSVIYLANPSGGCRGLYITITTALGATPRFHKAEAIAQVASLLAAEASERHRQVVFLIDEAHLLTPEQLEELRLLSNAEMDSSSPFAGILLGQPTLSARLRQGVFAALDQRISVRYELQGMDLAESVAYLRHHLELAGRTDPIIADDAAARMHRYANGIPRSLNNAARAAFMAAAADGKGIVDDVCAKKAVAELTRP